MWFGLHVLNGAFLEGKKIFLKKTMAFTESL